MKILRFVLFFSCSVYSKDYKILTLPAGGASGIMNVHLLQHIESQTNKKIVELFDEIWCCSAGSIIAGFLTLSNGQAKTFEQISKFFEDVFSNFYSAYFIREKFNSIVQDALLKDALIPIRVLTGASYDMNNPKWDMYGLSGIFQNARVCDAVSASCTVYPYVFRQPYKIKLNEKEPSFFVDAGSLCCELGTPEPTAYFLEKFIKTLKEDDTLTVYFLPNAFTPSIDYAEIHKVLEKSKANSWAIRYRDNSYNKSNKKQIEIVNISSDVDCVNFIKDYIQKLNYISRMHVLLINVILEKLVGKENAAGNLIATGLIKLSALKEESNKIIKNSKNFQALLDELNNA